MSRTFYYTINRTSESIYKEKGSKFIGIAIPVQSVNEVRSHQESLRKKYYDARHHCYAYVIGEDYAQFRANDDGEPNHSAGDPILGQIRSRDLTNILVIVIRYFGGTKLGVGGLIHAYKTAAEEAIDNNNILKKEITSTVKIDFDYESTNEIMRLCKNMKLTIVSQEYEAECSIIVNVTVGHTDQLLNKLQTLQDRGNNIQYLKM